MKSVAVQMCLQVYGLGSVQVLLLMRNLSINLTSPDFEDHVSIHATDILDC